MTRAKGKYAQAISDAIFSSSGMQPATQINDLTMNFKIGTVTVS